MLKQSFLVLVAALLMGCVISKTIYTPSESKTIHYEFYVDDNLYEVKFPDGGYYSSQKIDAVNSTSIEQSERLLFSGYDKLISANANYTKTGIVLGLTKSYQCKMKEGFQVSKCDKFEQFINGFKVTRLDAIINDSVSYQHYFDLNNGFYLYLNLSLADDFTDVEDIQERKEMMDKVVQSFRKIN